MRNPSIRRRATSDFDASSVKGMCRETNRNFSVAGFFCVCGRRRHRTSAGVNPPHVTDEPIIARLKRIGLEAGKSFDVARVDPSVKKAIADAPAQAQKLMEWKLPTLARVVNGWSMNTDTMGVYGGCKSD